MRLTGFRIRNFKMFRDVSVRNLPPLAIFVGANASGKSTLFDVFRFLRELFIGESLNDTFAKRDGFAEVLSRGAKESMIEIALNFLLPSKGGESPNVEAKYMIRFGVAKNFPFISEERFVIKDMTLLCVDYDADNKKIMAKIACEYGGEHGELKHKLEGGPAIVLEGFGRTSFMFESRLAVAVGEGGRRHLFPAVNRDKYSLCSQAREFICDLFVGDFEPIPIRESAKATGIDRLSEKGENLALVAKKIREKNPDKFESAVSALRRFVPEIKTVEPTTLEDGYAFLRFIDRNFDRPFNSRAMSDGTVLAFAYLLLLADSEEKLVCFDEIERSLYPHMLDAMIAEVRRHTIENKGQAMLTTHSSDLLDCAELEEVFWLAKSGGETVIHRAQDNKTARALVKSGDPLGVIWHKGDFEGADPSA